MKDNNPYEVIEHTWDTAPADLWPLIQDWITRYRQSVRFLRVVS